MATESDLRDLLQGPEPEGRAAIDLDAVLTRARRRRRPRVVAAQVLGSVALVGVLGTVVVVSLPRADESAMLSTQEAAGGSEADAAPFVDEDAAKIAPCGWNFEVPPLLGWEMTVSPIATAPTTAVGIDVTLGMDARIPETGTLTVTAINVLSDGVVVAYAWPVDASAHVDLGAGESADWQIVAPLVSCDAATGVLPAGTYQVVVDAEYLADGSVDYPEPIRGQPTDVPIG